MRQRTHLEILSIRPNTTMARFQRNFIIKTTSSSSTTTSTTATSSHSQSSFINPIKQSTKRSKTCTASVPVEMAAASVNPPVEIGTSGTVGSLIMQEIEYFSQLELGCKDGNKPRSNIGPVAATKKKRGSSRLIPSMCSMVEISDNRSGFGYRNLKSDVKKLQV
ncbi:Ankyrin repeat family protein [Hibiscus syriacus]|uniref:Ankyrin repeat family protein n=1 Tax=Hibiscus syriacus TaxID=106335 RepID=A0A6A2X796_HIBSY|nr:Ankyrin repeat family protein [Hibiscus syriacus]